MLSSCLFTLWTSDIASSSLHPSDFARNLFLSCLCPFSVIFKFFVLIIFVIFTLLIYAVVNVFSVSVFAHIIFNTQTSSSMHYTAYEPRPAHEPRLLSFRLLWNSVISSGKLQNGTPYNSILAGLYLKGLQSPICALNTVNLVVA